MSINPDELTMFTDIDPDEIHLVPISANGVTGPLLAKAAGAGGRVIKAQDEQRFLLCVVYSPHVMPVRGLDGRTDLASPKVLEKACWRYAAKGLRTGMYHQPGHEDAAVCVENYIHRGPDWDVHDDGSLIVKSGDWLAGFILSPAVWSLYKEGKISGVSLQGSAGRKMASAKAIARAEGKQVKKSKILKQLEKAARQDYPSVSSPHVTGVNLAGAGSTIGKPGTAERVVEAVFGQLDEGVRKAQGDLAMAEQGTELAKMRARSNLSTALRRRFTGKLIIAENVRGERPASPFGTALFKNGSTFQLPDDDPDIGYLNDSRK